MKQRLSGPLLVREMPAETAVQDSEARRVRISFSSEQPVIRSSFFDDDWVETLGHAEGEPEMARLNDGAPVLYGHRSDRNSHIGVVERAWLENGRGYADIRLSGRDDVAAIWRDVADGIIRNTSVGYQIHERTLTRAVDGGPDEYRVTRWTPMEISLVSVPADATVGVGRGANGDDNTRFSIHDIEEDDMSEHETTTEPEVEETRAAPDPDAIRQQATEAATKSERKRVADILAIAARHDAADLGQRAIADGHPVERFRAALLEHLAERSGPEIQKPVSIQPGADQSDKQRQAASEWLLYRHGQPQFTADGQRQRIEIDGNPYRGMSLLRMAEHCLQQAGIRTQGLDTTEIAMRAITHSTSDFSVVLENTMHKELQSAFGAVPDVWRRFSSVGSVSDFRPHYRYRMGTFGDILEVSENNEFKDASISDADREMIAAKTKGRILNVSRQMIINDDLGAFLGIARMMGRGAARTLEKDWFALLTSGSGTGPTMGDGTVLFHSDHNNLGGTGGMTPATMDNARRLLANQMDKDSNDYIGLLPFGVMVPDDIYAITTQVLNSESDPTAANANSRKFNYAQNMVQLVIPTPRITSHWYMFAAPADEPVLEVAFLNGQQSPAMDMQEGFRVDGVQWKVRFDYGVAAVGWRGAVRTAKQA